MSFLPVFFLTGRDHKLFAPLAWIKTFAMVAALLVAVFLVPALCRLLRERLRPIEENPVSSLILWVHEPTLRFFAGP